MTTVTIREQEHPKYIVLRPGNYPARTGPDFQQHITTPEQLNNILEAARESSVLALDFETEGNDYTWPLTIVGLGLAWDTGSCYIPYNTVPSEDLIPLVNMLLEHKGLIAHNVYFDGGVARTNWGKHCNWLACTYALLAMTANEGHPDAGWGLKEAQVDLLGWGQSNELDLHQWLIENGYKKQNGVADLSYMHLVPHDILGKYCVLDAESCYLLYTHILEPVATEFPGLADFFYDQFMGHIISHIDQKIAGIEVNRNGIVEKNNKLHEQFEQATRNILQLPELQEPIRRIEADLRKGIYEKMPAQFKKNGQVSKVYLKKIEKIEQIEKGLVPEYNFNPSSNIQLQRLMYDELGHDVHIRSESGAPAVSIKALKKMGDLGRVLVDRMYTQKEIGFTEKYLELTEKRNTIHPSYRLPGTVTGRLSGKEPNLQQIPKTKSMMSLFQAREGMAWVDLDYSALEPVVATEFSQDPNMLLIYGDGRPSNDIYLFVGAGIEGMGDKIRAAGYDRVNTTPEGLARAKKECKHERNICKTVTLACQYGAGVNKVMQTLENDGIYLDYYEVEKIHRGYWETFAKLHDYSRALYFEWKRNGGYILNGMGRPMSVPEYMKQDLLNRFVQSTGHDILVKYVGILLENLRRNRIKYTPIILDFHDATTVEVPEKNAEETVQIFKQSLAQLNEELGGTITLKGVPVIGYNLAEVKEPEEE